MYSSLTRDQLSEMVNALMEWCWVFEPDNTEQTYRKAKLDLVES